MCGISESFKLTLKPIQHPVPLLAELPRLVETVIHSLDPNVPHLRESCLKAATQVLHNLVSQFPNVSFHQTTQRLAVGTQKAVIIIWDLKTATRWHVLEVPPPPLTSAALLPLFPLYNIPARTQRTGHSSSIQSKRRHAGVLFRGR